MEAVLLQIVHAVTNLDGTFVEVDEAFSELLHLTPAELAACKILSVTHPDDRQHNSAALGLLIECGTPFWIRKRYIREDGSVAWVLNHVSKIRSPAGKTRITAATFVLPSYLGDWDSPDPLEQLALQTQLLKKLI